jgi:hypothetical protein
VGEAANSVDKPNQEEFEESKLPERMGTAYRAMYAHGMHLRIRSTEEEKVTCDSGVAAVVLRRRRGRVGERTGEVEKMEYVGWIEETLELKYRNHYYIVLVCAWIPGRTTGLNPKVVHDQYGIMVGNFNQTMPLGSESFTFPTQCIQVFYSDDKIKNASTRGDWKVICRTNVRGRRGDLSTLRPNIEMLASNRDSDFEGLAVLQ